MSARHRQQKPKPAPLKKDSPTELEYRDKRQVKLDISRVPITKAAAAKLEKRIGLVLSQNPELHYYQGFHDVAMHTHTQAQLENLALQQLRDFMAPNLEPTMNILKLVPEILIKADPNNIGRYFATAKPHSRKLQGFFALSPIVTLFSHDCTDTEVIAPIIRTTMREGLSYALYLYVAIVLKFGPSINDLKTAFDEFEEDGIEMQLQGVCLNLNKSNFNELDTTARRLRSMFPLRKLPSFEEVSKFSVLKSGKVTKRSTAIFMMQKLNEKQKSAARTLVVLGLSALAFGMVWSRMHR